MFRWTIGIVCTLFIAPIAVNLLTPKIGTLVGTGGGSDDGKTPPPREKPGPVVPRPFRKTADVLLAVAQDLRRHEPAMRTQRVYLTLHHLHNNTSLSEENLDQFRETLRQLATYLSPPGAAVVFEPIDTERTVYAFNGSDLGLDLERAWSRILKRYPYGLDYTSSSDVSLCQAWLDLEKQGGLTLPFVRADWFVQAVVRPPLAGPAGALQLPTKPLPAAVSAWAQHYAEQKLDLTAAALELGTTDIALVEQKIRSDRQLQQSLGPLVLVHGTVLRRNWESVDFIESPFQKLSRILEIGTPMQ